MLVESETVILVLQFASLVHTRLARTVSCGYARSIGSMQFGACDCESIQRSTKVAQVTVESCEILISLYVLLFKISKRGVGIGKAARKVLKKSANESRSGEASTCPSSANS